MKTTTSAKKTHQAGAPEDDLPKLASPARRALAAAGCTRLAHQTKFSEAEVKQWHGIGPNAFEQLRRALAARGLSFAGQKTRKA